MSRSFAISQHTSAPHTLVSFIHSFREFVCMIPLRGSLTPAMKLLFLSIQHLNKAKLNI